MKIEIIPVVSGALRVVKKDSNNIKLHKIQKTKLPQTVHILPNVPSHKTRTEKPPCTSVTVWTWPSGKKYSMITSTTLLIIIIIIIITINNNNDLAKLMLNKVDTSAHILIYPLNLPSKYQYTLLFASRPTGFTFWMVKRQQHCSELKWILQT